MNKSSDFTKALPPKRLEKQFQDAKPLYTESEALIEANRCLNCYDAPCIAACPTGIDIPSFIKKISSGNIRGSAKVIFEANMMGASTARVCPVEELCVGACVYNDLNHTPIEIGRLQRYAVTKALESEKESGKKLFASPKRALNKRVALIGSGPASLSCAAYLAMEGVQAAIFEKDNLPGGLNTTAVAPYKFQTEDTLDEVKWILQHGIELKMEFEIGKDIQFSELMTDYDAIFIGCGLGKDNRLKLPGFDGPDVFGALEIIRQIKNDNNFQIPEKVNSAVVIGGGNTAIDIARELAMLGVADVKMVYRRSKKEMSGYGHELASAKHYGVKFIENTIPVEILRKAGSIQSLKVKSVTSDHTTEIPCEWVVGAIGQAKHAIDIESDIEIDESGCVVVDPVTRQTGDPKVYAGGDCINGGQEVVNAAADGREAAFHMLKNWGIEPSYKGETYYRSLMWDKSKREIHLG